MPIVNFCNCAPKHGELAYTSIIKWRRGCAKQGGPPLFPSPSGLAHPHAAPAGGVPDIPRIRIAAQPFVRTQHGPRGLRLDGRALLL